MLPLFNLNRRSLQSIYLTICILASVCLSQNAPPNPPSPSNYTSFNFTSVNTETARICRDTQYCSPLAGDTWKLGTRHLLYWNYLFPELVVIPQVDVKLYLVENPRDAIYEGLNIANRDGQLGVDLAKDKFYAFSKNPKVEPGFNYILKQVYYTVTPAGSQNQNPTRSPYFYIVDTEPPGLPTPTLSSSPTPTQTTKTSTTETPTSTSSPTPTPDPNNSSQLPGYIIALIVIASLTGLVTVATIIYVLLSKRNESPPAAAGGAATATQLEKGDGTAGIIALDNNPDGSAKPVPANVISSRDSAQTQNSTTPLAPNTNLSSTDAQMLSETFRNMMRKPSWTTDQQYPSNLAKQRLEEELEREGVGLQDIQPKKLTIQTEPEESPIQPPAPSRPPNP